MENSHLLGWIGVVHVPETVGISAAPFIMFVLTDSPDIETNIYLQVFIDNAFNESFSADILANSIASAKYVTLRVSNITPKSASSFAFV